MNIVERVRAIFSGGQKQVEVPAADTFSKFLSLRMQEFDIEPRGDRVGESITYQWKDHGPFTVQNGVIDQSTTVVSLSPTLEAEFKAEIESAYNQYLQPWVQKGLSVPKVVVNTRSR